MAKENLLKMMFVTIILIGGFLVLSLMLFSRNNSTKIVFFGLGKADSIYIENGSNNMLIDAGLKSHKEVLLLKLEILGVKKLDYVILTHPDKDHIGSASYILDRFEVGELIQSNHIKGTKREARIDNVIKEKDIKDTRLTSDLKFDLGDLNITIFAPQKQYYKEDNDYSLVTLIEDGQLNYLFAGDAEKELLDELLGLDLPDIDIYKVAHHGRENSNSKNIIKKINPKHSIITNIKGEGEIDYILEEEDSEVIYVFEKDLMVFSDSKELRFH